MPIITHITNVVYEFVNFTDLYTSIQPEDYDININKIAGAKYNKIHTLYSRHYNLCDIHIANCFNNFNMIYTLEQIFRNDVLCYLSNAEVHKIKDGGYFINVPDSSSDESIILLYILYSPIQNNNTIIVNNIKIPLHTNSLYLIDSSHAFFIKNVLTDKLKYFRAKLKSNRSNAFLFNSMLERVPNNNAVKISNENKAKQLITTIGKEDDRKLLIEKKD